MAHYRTPGRSQNGEEFSGAPGVAILQAPGTTVDDQAEKLAGRLGLVPIDHLLAELERRKYTVTRDKSAAVSSTALGRPTTDVQPVRLSHFPDNILLAVAKQRGLVVTQTSRSGLDAPRGETKPEEHEQEPSLLQALDDTYTRDQMETAYQEMLALRKRRRSNTQG